MASNASFTFLMASATLNMSSSPSITALSLAPFGIRFSFPRLFYYMTNFLMLFPFDVWFFSLQATSSFLVARVPPPPWPRGTARPPTPPAALAIKFAVELALHHRLDGDPPDDLHHLPRIGSSAMLCKAN